MNPFFLTDGYKTGHPPMYPKGTILVYSNFTPRSAKHAPSKVSKEFIICAGPQLVMHNITNTFNVHFFDRDKYTVCAEIKREYEQYLGSDYDMTRIEALHDLGYLPISVSALPEGDKVPIGVPVLTIHNTLPEFFWITNFLETILSTELWMIMNSATIAYNYKALLTKWATKTDPFNVGFVEFQGHDFSMRGMATAGAAIASGIGHAMSFLGSDSLPVIPVLRNVYQATGGVVHSVNATEHSVMCAGGKQDEIGTFRHLMETFPTGILSIVSDTWDLWKVLTEYLPALKEEILARDGKIVIRPDSGDPVDIICGKFLADNGWDGECPVTSDYVAVGGDDSPEGKGVIELLWDLFGGTINDEGYKCLDPHIGAIYGDSITLARADEICRKLEAKGFASTNVVLGIGSFTYQYNTRDTFGFAMKATYVELKGHCEEPADCETYGHDCKCTQEHTIARPIFKDPVTDDGTKKSAKGLLQVTGDPGNYELRDMVDWDEQMDSALEEIYRDGKFLQVTDLARIRRRINQQIEEDVRDTN